MDESDLHIHTIPSEASFLDALARGILDRYGDQDDPLAISDILVLLPTRRAVRALGDAFRRQAGGNVILPSVRPIGDVDEDIFALADEPAISGTEPTEIPPAISSVRRTLLIMDRFRRRFLLSRLVKAWLDTSGGGDSVVLATELAQSLSQLLDTLQTEDVSLERLPELVPDRFADHWRQSLEFLDILHTAWPQILKEQGAIDPGDRRNKLLLALHDSWERSPPDTPVIAAGSTGSIPATAALLKVIAHLPKGHVVLPGVDLDMPTEMWDRLEQGHPQDGMRRLLDGLSADRAQITPWDDTVAARSLQTRTKLLNRSLNPWQATGQWQNLSTTIGASPSHLAAALQDIHRIDAADPGEEAGVIALIMREALETPGKTAALVTPDRNLARRVASELRRWRIEVNDSAGRPLTTCAVFSYLRLVARVVETDGDAVALLSLLKHPMAAGNRPAAEFRRLGRLLERGVLRGPTVPGGLDGLVREAERRLESQDRKPTLRLLRALDAALAPLAELYVEENAPFTDLVRAHVQAAEQLAATDTEDGAARLWLGDDGEAAALFLNELMEHGATLGDIDPLHYLELFEVLGRGRAVRGARALHPAISIWGPLEARLQRADITVLGGLNEGTWPLEVTVDPWLNRPMRAELGLSAPEQRIGLSAHDFVQGASAPVVYLTRSEKVEGTPTVPSRWLLRLDTLLEGLKAKDALHSDQHYVSLYRAMLATDMPEQAAHFTPASAPRPAPPLAARPRELSVTQVETLIRDPYAVYARHVLGLRPLDPVGADPGAAERGILIHDILNGFVEAYPDALPDDAEQRLLEIGRDYFDRAVEGPAVEAFWWPRFESFVYWFVPHERQWRADGAHPQLSEATGRLKFNSVGGSFVLTARADRLDKTAQGGLAVIDYKTGAAPSVKQVTAGLSPQLPLEAGIALDGGFQGLRPGHIDSLAYIRIAGGQMGGALTLISKDVPDMVAASIAGVKQLIAAYDDPAMPYLPRLRPFRDDIAGPYDHLARVQEWQTSGLGGDE